MFHNTWKLVDHIYHLSACISYLNSWTMIWTFNIVLHGTVFHMESYLSKLLFRSYIIQLFPDQPIHLIPYTVIFFSVCWWENSDSNLREKFYGCHIFSMSCNKEEGRKIVCLDATPWKLLFICGSSLSDFES